MPNWCVNQVDIQGDEAEIVRLVEFVKTDECAFDFRKIVPPPDTDRYRGASSSSTFVCGCEQESRVVGKLENGNDKYGWFVGDVEVPFGGKCQFIFFRSSRRVFWRGWVFWTGFDSS